MTLKEYKAGRMNLGWKSTKRAAANMACDYVDRFCAEFPKVDPLDLYQIITLAVEHRLLGGERDPF